MVGGLDSVRGNSLSTQDIKDTRDACRVLAERAVHFTLAVYQQLKSGGDDAGLKEHVATFIQLVPLWSPLPTRILL